MKIILITTLSIAYFPSFSQVQQVGNLFVQNNINAPVQIIETNVSYLYNNNDNNPIAQQQSSNYNKQTNAIVNSNEKGFDMTFNFSSRSVRSSSNIKTHKHTFHKKLTKFNRNLYGKMTLHKKSKHLVDVCFNWK